MLAMARAAQVLAVAGLVFASAAFAQDLPAGYRFLTRKELSDPYRAKSSHRFAKVVADFNGDGIEDEALLLKNTKSDRRALFVRLSDGEKGARWIQLDTIVVEVSTAIGYIEVIHPGGVQYYDCFEDDKVCNFGRRKEITLSTAALAYFEGVESMGSFFVWDQKTGKFRRAWRSDS